MSREIGKHRGAHRHSSRASAYLASTAVLLSFFALALVLGNVAAGVPPQPDENASAHLFQLAMVLQAPLLLCFVATADWSRGRAKSLLVLQLCAAGAAFAVLWWSGY